MNGKELAPRHGYPVRAIVPGVLGARSVKWLDRITVSTEESSCFYQQSDYKVLPPQATDMQLAKQFWPQCPAMLEMPINACVATPKAESTVLLPTSGLVDVKGYAVPQGHNGPVVRVQVSGDEGATWVDAQIEDGGKDASKWSWVLFSTKIQMKPGMGQKILAKATDAGGNTQEHLRSPWNLRGVGYNGFEAVVDLTVVESSRL
jgi:sulfite oxidase